MVLLELNNTIYMGDYMIYSLYNSIQREDNDLRIDLRPKVYDKNNNNSQLITFPYGTSIPVDYNGVLPRRANRRLTKYEVENCVQIALTWKLDWDFYVKGGSLSNFEAHLNNIELVLEPFEGADTGSADLSCLSLSAMISDTPILHRSNNTAKEKIIDKDMYFTVGVLKIKSFPSSSPKKLSAIWGIWLNTEIKSL